MKLEIRNGRLIDPRHNIDRVTTLFCAAGRILSIDIMPEGWHANRVIDASGLIVCPGLVDLSVQPGDPMRAQGEYFAVELQAALAGGVTSLVSPPDGDPPLDEPGLVEMLKFRTASLNHCHVYPLGALTLGLHGEALTEMGALHDAGCVGFSQGDRPIANSQVLLRAIQYAATLDVAVWLRPEDYYLQAGGVAHAGEVATRLGLAGIAPLAETVAVSAMLALAQAAGCKLHLCRISCAESVAQITAARARGMMVTCDVSAAHLHLTENDIGYFDADCKVRPPLRSLADRDALREATKNGVIDAVVSDHRPLNRDDKLVPFAEAKPGMSGVELLLSLVIKFSAETKMNLPDALRLVTAQPGAIAHIPGGHIAPGAPADICIFDPTAYRVISAASLASAGKNSAFLGYELPAIVRYAVVGGRVAFESKLPH